MSFAHHEVQLNFLVSVGGEQTKAHLAQVQEAQLHGEIDLRKHVDRLVANERHRLLRSAQSVQFNEPLAFSAYRVGL